MADMYGNYDVRPANEYTPERLINMTSYVMCECAKANDYNGNPDIFGATAAIYLEKKFGFSVIEKMLRDKELVGAFYLVCVNLSGNDKNDDAKDFQEVMEIIDTNADALGEFREAME